MRHLSSFMLYAIFMLIVSAQAAEIDLRMTGGYTDNATQSSDQKLGSGLFRLSMETEPSLAGSESGSSQLNLGVFVETENFVESQIPGNTLIQLKPNYRFSFLNEALQIVAGYRLSKNYRHTLIAESITGRRQNLVSTDPTLYSSDPYLAHRGDLESSYMLDSSIGSISFGVGGAFEKLSYDSSTQEDQVASLGGSIQWLPSESLNLSLSAGQTRTMSNLADYSSSGPYFQASLLFSPMESVLLNGSFRMNDEDFGSRHDGLQQLSLGLELTLSQSTTLEAEFTRSALSSTNASYSYDSNEFSAGFAFHF